MRPRIFLPMALLALAACGDEDATPQHFTASVDKVSTSADDKPATPARAVPNPADSAVKPMPPQVTVPVALAPIGKATVRGSGAAKAVGRSTSIDVSLAQAIAGQTYEGAVRQGACTAAGPTIASLFPVSADSLGAGRASSDVPVPIDSLTGAPHIVVYGRGGRPEACAAIGRAGPVPPSEPRPSPNAPPKQSDEPPPDSAQGRGQSD